MSVHREITTRAVVLARLGAGEGSLRIVMYTEASGLVTALAKSAREERSKLRAHLQSGTRGVFRLVKGRDVWRVTGATGTENVHFTLPESAARESAARTLSAVRQFVRGEGPDEKLFGALWDFVGAMSLCDTAEKARAAESLAVLRILSALGYVPAGALGDFLGDSYDESVIARAVSERAALVRAVNEAIAASGL